MDNVQKLALATSRNFRFYFDSAYRHGNSCISIIRNSCNSSRSSNNGLKFNKDSDILCSNSNTRQRFVEIANPSANLIQRRNISSTTVNLSNIFNIQDEKDFKERVLMSQKPVIVDFYAM
jgi:hypothetical protein